MGRNKHIKKCNECEFSAPSVRKLENHKKIQHAPDDFYEQQAFDKLLYSKIWRLRAVQDSLEGMKVYKSKISEEQAFDKLLYSKTWRLRAVQDSLEGLKVYKSKIKNTLMDYMREQDCETKWYLGVLVEMVKLDKEGEIMETIHPMFQSSPRIQVAMYGFHENYGNAVEEIQAGITDFDEKGSRWVLNNVDNISINIAGYDPTLYQEEDSEEMIYYY